MRKRRIINEERQVFIMKKIAILGSTGSIGTQSLEVIRNQPDMEATVLAAGSNVELLEKQIREFHPKLVCVYKEDAAKLLKQAVADLDVTIVSGISSAIIAVNVLTILMALLINCGILWLTIWRSVSISFV